MTAIKICGITDKQGMQAAITQRVERIGLVFADNSPRKLALENAGSLAELARGKTEITAVLVNPGNKQLQRVVEAVLPDYLQLHGRETPERVRSIWKRFHIPVIKAIAIASVKDVAAARLYARTAAEILFDAKPPKGASREGGFGTSFDWSHLQAGKIEGNWLLAGGLSADNICQAIAATGAPMVDVSSGVESSVGVKDPVRIEQFCDLVRTMDRPDERK